MYAGLMVAGTVVVADLQRFGQEVVGRIGELGVLLSAARCWASHSVFIGSMPAWQWFVRRSWSSGWG